MRRALVLLLLLALTGVGFWHLLRQMPAAAGGIDPWIAVPSDAALIISVPDVRSFWEEWKRTAQLASVFGRTASGQALDRVWSRLTAGEADGAVKVPLILAILRGQDGSLNACIVLSCAVPGVLPEIAAGLGARPDDTLVEDKEPVQLRPDTAMPDLYAVLRNDLLLLSSDPALLTDMVDRTRNQRPNTENWLSQARGTLGRGADVHALLQLSQAWPILEHWVAAEALGPRPAGNGWAALDIRIRPEALLMSGVFFPTDSTDILDETARSIPEDLLRVLPSEVTVLNMGPLELRTELRASDSIPSLPLDWGTGPSAFGSGDLAGEGPAHWLVVGSMDTARATATLASLADPGTGAIQHRGHRIYHSAALSALTDNDSAQMMAWAVVLGDHVVIADRSSAARHAVDAYLDGGTLAQDLRTDQLLMRNASPALRTIWCDLGRGQAQLAQSATPAAAATMSSHAELWNELGGLLFQVRHRDKGLSYIQIDLQHAPISRPVDRTRWSLTHTAPLIGVPQLIRNHANGMGEILVQDSSHRLILISTGGQVLWERSLDGPMLAPAVQVDRFRNGKLQLLIGTAERVHLIDRNGADVAGFPVRLHAKASASLSVVDYEKDGHYRILVPLEDGRLLNLGPDGGPVPGWAPDRLLAPITSEVRHLRIKGKDHLVFSDAKGRIHVLDRRGAKRMAEGPDIGQGSQLIAANGGSDLRSTELVYLTKEGELRSTDMAGHNARIGHTEPGRFGVYPSGSDTRLWWLAGDSLWIRHPGGDLSLVPHGLLDVRQAMAIPGSGDGAWQLLAGAPPMLHLTDTRGALSMQPMKALCLAGIGDLDRDGGMDLVTVMPDGRLTAQRAAP